MRESKCKDLIVKIKNLIIILVVLTSKVEASFVDCFTSGYTFPKAAPKEVLSAAKSGVMNSGATFINSVKEQPGTYLAYHAFYGALFAAIIWTRPGSKFLRSLQAAKSKVPNTISQSIKADFVSGAHWLLNGGKSYVAYHAACSLMPLCYLVSSNNMNRFCSHLKDRSDFFVD